MFASIGQIYKFALQFSPKNLHWRRYWIKVKLFRLQSCREQLWPGRWRRDGQSAGRGRAGGEKVVGERAYPNQWRRARGEGRLDLVGWYGKRLGREYEDGQRAENKIIC